MSCYLIEYQNKQKVMVPVTSREKYLELRSLAVHKEYISRVRSGDTDMKRRLLQFNYSCIPGEDGKLKGCKTPSTTFGMDIDHVKPEDMKPLAEKILQMKNDLELLMLERSARMEGYHLVMKRNPALSQEDNLKAAAEKLGVEYDSGAKDITRVFFATSSSEDDLLYLDDELFEQDPLPTLQVDLPHDGEALNTLSNKEAEDRNSIKKSPHYGGDAEGRGGLQGGLQGGLSGVEAAGASYLGIPYSSIIAKYWEMFYDGKTPVKSNRDTLTYELANILKHICGFDRGLLAKVIPCYDGFSEAEKMKCIDSALSGKRTQMPKRLRDVIFQLQRQRMNEDANYTPPLGDEGLDELFYFNRIPKGVMVQGVKDSIDAAGHTLSMPALTAICPAIGARATGVRLVVHGKPNTLNLIAYIAGDFGSGKGQMDDIINAWMAEDRAMAEMYNEQWEEWRDKYKANRNKKELPVEPKFPKVWITLNNTTANLAESLSNVQGRHAFSFTPEADVVSLKWKSSISDFSTMIRQSYDASSYDREARSVDAVNVHIAKLLWNVVMCGTPDALYRVVNNYTDGFQSRIAVARTPDNTYAPLDDNPAILTDLQKERIEQVSHLLPLLNGTISLPKLERRGRQWLEDVRLETMKNDDRVMARQRFRVCVTAQRMTCCLMLAAVCAKLIKEHGINGAETRLKQNQTLWMTMMEKMQTPAFLEMFDIIADSLIDNAMYFFRDRITQAFNSPSYAACASTSGSGSRTRKGKNDSIFSRLPQEFSFTDAMNHSVAVKGSGVTQNAVQQMLKNWQKQELVSLLDDGTYRKMS